MRYRSFLVYVPFMFAISLILLGVTDRYDNKATFVAYEAVVEKKDIGSYAGERILEGGTTGQSIVEHKLAYNGEELKDNGMPYGIKVNKTQNVVTIYTLGEDGCYSVPVKAMVCSVGLKDNTPSGTFKLGARDKWLSLEDGVYGQYATTITGNILFHSVPYYTRDKADLEVDEYNKLGNAASAGCVRLAVVDARWIFEHCEENTLVDIFESDYVGPFGKPMSIHIDHEKQNENWDPTDPDRDNPYMGEKPVILGVFDREFERFADFDITAGVSALDSEGNDITDQMKVDGQVDFTQCGTYKVTYRVKDFSGKSIRAHAKFVVKDEEKPQLYVNQTVDSINAFAVTSSKQLHDLLLQNVTAYDGNEQLEDKAILVDYSEIFEKKYGKCHIKYRAKDSVGNESDVVVLSVNVDMEPPCIQLKNEFEQEVHVSSLQNDEYLLSFLDISDNSGAFDVKISRPLTYTIGEPYKVIYCATDASENVTTFCVTYQIKE